MNPNTDTGVTNKNENNGDDYRCKILAPPATRQQKPKIENKKVIQRTTAKQKDSFLPSTC